MLRFLAADWTEIVRLIDEMSNLVGPLTIGSFISGGESIDKLATALSRIEELCRRLNLTFSASYAKELFDRANVTLAGYDLSSGDGGRIRSRRMLAAQKGISGFENAEQFVVEVKILRKRLDDELLNREFFALDSDQAARFSDPHPFGEDVEASFPSAINDIEEASKCLALERPTASAFHAMRVTEVGLKALTKTIRVAYAPSWESHLKQLQTHIDSLDKSDAAQREDRTFYSETAAQLGAIKDAWRNPVMHTVGRHSAESATEVFGAVRMFMRNLATKIRE